MNKSIFFNIVFTIFYTTNIFCGENTITLSQGYRVIINNIGIDSYGNNATYSHFKQTQHMHESPHNNCTLNYTDITDSSNQQLTDIIGCSIQKDDLTFVLQSRRGEIEAINKSLSNNSNLPVTIQDLQTKTLYTLNISRTYETISKKTTPEFKHTAKSNLKEATIKSNPKSKTSWPTLMAIKKHFTNNKWMYILAACLFIFKKIYLKS